MPDSRTERIAFAAGLAAIVALAIALIPAYSHYRHSPPAAPAVAVNGGAAQQTSFRPAPTALPKQTPPATKPRARTAPKPAVTKKRKAVLPAKPAKERLKLTLAATRGDCWVEVRDGSSTGKVLYVGTLTKGKSFKVAVSKLWVRFGAPQNVDLAIAGKPARLPGGVQDVLVTSRGVKPAPA